MPVKRRRAESSTFPKKEGRKQHHPQGKGRGGKQHQHPCPCLCPAQPFPCSCPAPDSQCPSSPAGPLSYPLEQDGDQTFGFLDRSIVHASALRVIVPIFPDMFHFQHPEEGVPEQPVFVSHIPTARRCTYFHHIVGRRQEADHVPYGAVKYFFHCASGKSAQRSTGLARLGQPTCLSILVTADSVSFDRLNC